MEPLIAARRCRSARPARVSTAASCRTSALRTKGAMSTSFSHAAERLERRAQCDAAWQALLKALRSARAATLARPWTRMPSAAQPRSHSAETGGVQCSAPLMWRRSASSVRPSLLRTCTTRAERMSTW